MFLFKGLKETREVASLYSGGPALLHVRDLQMIGLLPVFQGRAGEITVQDLKACFHTGLHLWQMWDPSQNIPEFPHNACTLPHLLLFLVHGFQRQKPLITLLLLFRVMPTQQFPRLKTKHFSVVNISSALTKQKHI